MILLTLNAKTKKKNKRKLLLHIGIYHRSAPQDIWAKTKQVDEKKIEYSYHSSSFHYEFACVCLFILQKFSHDCILLPWEVYYVLCCTVVLLVCYAVCAAEG